MSEAFKFERTKDGGASLSLNLGHSFFVVAMTPTEFQSIKDRIEAWHRDMHKREAARARMQGVSNCWPNAGTANPERQLRSTVVGTLMRRMSEEVPSHLMGAVAKAQLDARSKANVSIKLPKISFKQPPRPSVRQPVKGRPAPAAKPIQADRQKIALVHKALLTLANRRAVMLAFERRKTTKPLPNEITQGKAYAQAEFKKHGIPSTSSSDPFWKLPSTTIAIKIAAALKASERTGAPIKLSKAQAPRIDRSKLRVAQKALMTIATRRARFLAWQKKPGSQPSPSDMNAGKTWARDFMQRNGVPTAQAPHVFWDLSLPIIETKVNALVKLAEVQGAPAKPLGPPRPVATVIEPAKIAAVRRGLQILISRRGRWNAFQRKSAQASQTDFAAARDFARAHFTKHQIPTKLPGKTSFIAGWVVGQTPDPVTAFWAQPLPAIQAKVAEALKAAENDAPTKLPVTPGQPAPTVTPPAPGAVPAGTPIPGTQSTPIAPVSPGGGGGGGGGGGYTPGAMPPGQMPGDIDEILDSVAPGDTGFPPIEQDIPLQLPEEYPAGEQSLEEIPGEMPEEEIPGEVDVPSDEAPGDLDWMMTDKEAAEYAEVAPEEDYQEESQAMDEISPEEILETE